MPSLTPFNRWRNWGPNMLNKVLSGIMSTGLPRWHSGKESACQGRRRKTHGFNPWVRKIPWRRKWQSAPIFLPGKLHGQRSLEGFSPRGHRVRHDWAHSHIMSIRRKGYPFSVLVLGSWRLEESCHHNFHHQLCHWPWLPHSSSLHSLCVSLVCVSFTQDSKPKTGVSF